MDWSAESDAADMSLDDPCVTSVLEEDGVLRLVRSIPGQAVTGWESGVSVRLPPEYGDANALVVAGVGGSAMGADLVRGITRGDSTIPVVISRDYILPGFVGPETLDLIFYDKS